MKKRTKTNKPPKTGSVGIPFSIQNKSAIPLFCRSCTNQLVGSTNVKCQRKKQKKVCSWAVPFPGSGGISIFFSNATVCLSNAKKQKLQHLLSCLMVENRRVERKLVEQVIGLLLWYCGGAS